MMKKTIHIAIWLLVCVVAGALGAHFFHQNFWTAAMMVGLSLIVNGLIAGWEECWCDCNRPE